MTYRAVLIEFILLNPYVKERWETNNRISGLDQSFLDEINSVLESSEIEAFGITDVIIE